MNPLREARDRSMEAQALNSRQRHLIANATPEVDSLYEEFAVLAQQYGIRAEDSVGIVRRFRELLELEIREYTEEREVTRLTDTVLRESRPVPRPKAAPAPGVKALAAELRPALVVLRDPASRGSREIMDATRTVRRIVRSVPASKLLSDSMRVQLRGASFEVLADHVNGRAA
ncbi:MAG: hypothetical protein JWM31_31 [Solirubrobacterales bacterium]|nr:hypothetical protein [Solirubrobacterales bacterium]